MSADRSARRRALVVAAILLATFMVAIEATIVATAMPRIVGQLGGFAYYSWVFSAFLLAQTTSTVIYGRLSDIFGRKPVLIAGTALVLLASILCGLAWSMPSLILFRLLQGLGAGAILPVTTTIVGDLYRIEERGKIQGLLSSVWASSAVAGPLAGGVIVDHLHWAWIFWLNLPFGVLAIAGLVLFLQERATHRAEPIDYAGAALFSIAIVAFMLMLTEANASLPLLSALGAVFLLAGAAFLWQEGRAPAPMISLPLWRRRLIAACNLTTLLAGMALIGLTTILPLHVQGVLGRSPIQAGFALTMLILGWPLAVTLSSRCYRIFGIRRTLRFGSLMFPLGAAIFLLRRPDSSPVLAGAGSFVMGFGMGLLSITCIILIQESVAWTERGSATSSNLFARSLGNTLGATALGAVLNQGIDRFSPAHAATRLRELLEHPDGLSEVAADPTAQAALHQAVHLAFWAVLLLALVACVTCWWIPARQHMNRTA